MEQGSINVENLFRKHLSFVTIFNTKKTVKDNAFYFLMQNNEKQQNDSI